MNRLRMEQRAALTSAKREVERIERRIKKLLDLLLDDEIDMAEAKAEMKALDARRKELEVQLKAANEPPPLLHPSMADLYRSKVEELDIVGARLFSPRRARPVLVPDRAGSAGRRR